MQRNHYLIRGGVEGRERLRLLARVMRPTTIALFDRIGIEAGMACLDVGCGGGDVTLDLIERVGPAGRVVGWDIDKTKIDLARREADEKGIHNVEYRVVDIAQMEPTAEFDVVYSRFLLSHLKDPAGALAKFERSARPGCLVALEDIDFSGFFCYPDSAVLHRFIELFSESSKRRGGDPNMGLRLPGLLIDLGFERIQTNVVQPAGIDYEVKLMLPVTMENIAESVLADGLAESDEIDRVIAGLYELARGDGAFVSHPRVIQAWGYRT